jgi:hypothetical protein
LIMNKKAKWLAKHYQDVMEGGKSQYTHGDGWHDTEWGPCFHSIESQWRVVMPPKVTPVDMSVLVGSGIDCEFWDLKGVYNGQLVGITDAPEYRSLDDFWARCQPRMNYWFSAMNFRDVTALIIKLRNAGFDVERTHTGGPTIEFRITGIADDRCWPWEQGK